MCRNLIAVIVLFFTMTVIGCSSLQKVVHRQDIDQGNYLSAANTSRLEKGMTKQQVTYLLGTPMLQDPFGSNTWIYIFRQQPGHEKVKQETLTLTFDSKDILYDIKSDFPLKTATRAASTADSAAASQPPSGQLSSQQPPQQQK